MSYVLVLAILIGIIWLFVALMRRHSDHDSYATHDRAAAPAPPSAPTGVAPIGSHVEVDAPLRSPDPGPPPNRVGRDVLPAFVPTQTSTPPPPPTITQTPQRQSRPKPKARKLVRPACKPTPAARAAEPPTPMQAPAPPAVPAPCSTRPCRIIAIDWSGDARNAGSKIWLAEAEAGQLTDLRTGLDHDGIVRHLRREVGRGPLVVGLDFAFSFPGWFVQEQGFAAAPELWAAMQGGLAERWLSACEPPFWGRPGKRKCNGYEQFRHTEHEYRSRGHQAKSVFQIGGAGAVGTGSLRGIPVLHRLRRAGFSVWPFEPAADATLVEIYPRALTGPVVKSDATARRAYLEDCFPELDKATSQRAASSEDAFDAAVSALVMWQARDELAALPESTAPAMRLEGAIWAPRALAQ